MDEKTRGFIESRFDGLLKKELVPIVEWVEQEIPISSLRDLVLGYVIGSMETLGIGLTAIGTQECSEEDINAITTMVKRRLPEIIGKINRELGR